jgi:hypothetical protein
VALFAGTFTALVALGPVAPAGPVAPVAPVAPAAPAGPAAPSLPPPQPDSAVTNAPAAIQASQRMRIFLSIFKLLECRTPCGDQLQSGGGFSISDRHLHCQF